MKNVLFVIGLLLNLFLIGLGIYDFMFWTKTNFEYIIVGIWIFILIIDTVLWIIDFIKENRK